MESLPDELVTYILDYVEHLDLYLRVRGVNRRFRDIAITILISRRNFAFRAGVNCPRNVHYPFFATFYPAHAIYIGLEYVRYIEQGPTDKTTPEILAKSTRLALTDGSVINQWVPKMPRLRNITIDNFVGPNLQALRCVKNLLYMELIGARGLIGEADDQQVLKRAMRVSISFSNPTVWCLVQLSTQLTVLDLRMCQLTDLSFLKHLPCSLKSVDFSGNELTNVMPLKHHPKLSILILNDNKIEDLTPLLLLIFLHALNIQNNPIGLNTMTDLTVKVIFMYTLKLQQEQLQSLLPQCKICHSYKEFDLHIDRKIRHPYLGIF